MVFLFWFALMFLAYTFLGYPFLLLILSIFRRQTPQRRAIWPTVSLIIPAHNAASLISSKIRNSLELTYPVDKREVIVASDGSEDDTADIVRSFANRGIKLVEIPEWHGKHYAQMIARDVSHGEILVFTDVSVHLEPGALEKIVSNFADDCVGCVSSEDQVATGKRSWMGERLYVQFEIWLRRLEARVGSLVGNSGSFFAARRELCEMWHPDQSSDFFLALHAAKRGLRSVVDPECQGRYGLVRSYKAELQRKVRTVVHGLDVLFTHRDLLNPVRYGLFSWQLVSHKLFRWLVPLGIFSLLVSNSLLWNAGSFYRLFLVLQVGLYGACLLASVAGCWAGFKVLKPASFFVLGNAATVMAWLYFLSGEKFATWQPSERL